MNRDYRFDVLAVATAFALNAGAASAANLTDLHLQDVSRVQQNNATIAASGRAAMVHTRHEQALGLDPESRLYLLDRSNDKGVRSHRYRQTFRGLPIFGEHVVVNEDQRGDVRTLFGQMASGLALEIPSDKVRLSKAAALRIGKSAGLGNAVGFMRTTSESSELMIHIGDDGRARRAYVVSYLADTAIGGFPTRPIVIIDADSGAVLKQWENLQTAQIGTGPGGNAKTGGYEYGNFFWFLDVTQSGTSCTMENEKVKTVDLDGGSSNTAAFSYECPRNTYKTINGGYAPLNDAHYFGSVTYDMYKAYLDRAPLNSKIILRVHYLYGPASDDANWDGSYANFGDGWSIFYPLVSPDVVSHEVSHGFTEQNSELIYEGQSGGINEAYSDIAGEAAEHYMYGSNDFLVAAQVIKFETALRYMSNPPQDYRSIGHASQYTSSMNVHHSSGVYNKAFYLLATTSGWSTPMAFRVFARANDLNWTPSTNFNQGACGVQAAATDFGYNAVHVYNAFAAVGVTCPGPPPTPPPSPPVISGVYCYNSNSGGREKDCTVQYTASPAATVSWSGAYGYPSGNWYYRICGGRTGNLYVQAAVSNAYGTAYGGTLTYCN